MKTAAESALVSTEWLAAHLDAPDVRVVDASWYMPADNRDPKQEFAAAHIPGAVFFDIDEIADLDSGLPHTLPSPEKFTSRVRRLGLGDGNRIVVYDGGSTFSAARVWWMFRVFGHRDVVVLDGGMPKWQAEGRPLDDMPPLPRERHFTARLQSNLLRDLDQMKRNLTTGKEQVLDARSPGRFDGSVPEPRQGLRSGHIPGSRNLYFMSLFNEDGTYKKGDALREAVETAGVDLAAPIVTSCGSGVTASVLALALYELGAADVAVYDGSWTEWGGQADTPVAVRA